MGLRWRGGMSEGKRVWCLFLIVWWSVAGAQTLESPRTVIRTDVREVVVPVVVLDRQGHHIEGLNVSDFQVLEDGKLQRIVAFSTERFDPRPQAAPETGNPATEAPRGNPSLATPPANASNAAIPRRTYLILVDTLHSSFSNFGRVRDALGKFFETERDAGSQYALITLGREAKIVQDSTRDSGAIMAAVRSKEFAKLIQDSEAANTNTTVVRFEGLVDAYCAICRCGANQAASCADGLYKPQVQGLLNIFSERMLWLNREYLRKLEEIVRATADMPTSRTIVFISDGFNRFAGRELYAILQGHGVKEGIFTQNPRDTQPELNEILKIATGYNVKFYTLDSRGLYSEASLPGSFAAENAGSQLGGPVGSMIRSTARENTDALSELAHQTGGTFYENDNDLLAGIRRAFADGRERYLLAYVPENKSEDGKYRKIEVIVRDKKWRVNAKAGYWAATTH
jgi:VWFA-related protein